VRDYTNGLGPVGRIWAETPHGLAPTSASRQYPDVGASCPRTGAGGMLPMMSKPGPGLEARLR